MMRNDHKSLDLIKNELVRELLDNYNVEIIATLKEIHLAINNIKEEEIRRLIDLKISKVMHDILLCKNEKISSNIV